jgi:hypothetical protein
MLNTRMLLRSEIAWLAISLVFTNAFSFIIFGEGVFTGNMDLHVHDTYFVTPAYLILFFLFLAGGLTLYPRLSGLGNTQVSGFQPGLPFLFVSGLLLVMAIVVLVLTLFKAYKWGQYRGGNYRKE